MHLTIDIGNTLTKALVWDRQHPVGEVHTGPSSPDFILSLLDSHSDKRIVIASVVTLEAWLLKRLAEMQVLIVDANTPVPITSRYATPKTLGIDRICSAVGAKAQFPTLPVLAIDLGTCITCEVVTADGSYLGGSIAPGLRMRLRALSEFTSKLPLVEPRPFDSLVGTTTEESILVGVQHGIRMELDAMIEAQEAAFPGLQTVVTGGDFALFAHHLKTPIFADPILVLRGLHEILRYNL